MKFTITKKDIARRAALTYIGLYKYRLITSIIFLVCTIIFGIYTLTTSFFISHFLWIGAVGFSAYQLIDLPIRFKVVYSREEKIFKNNANENKLECELLINVDKYTYKRGENELVFFDSDIREVGYYENLMIIVLKTKKVIILPKNKEVKEILDEKKKNHQICFTTPGYIVFSWIVFAIAVIPFVVVLINILSVSHLDIFGFGMVVCQLEQLAIVIPFAIVSTFLYLKSKKIYDILTSGIILFIACLGFVVANKNTMYKSGVVAEAQKCSEIINIDFPYANDSYSDNYNHIFYYSIDFSSNEDFYWEQVFNKDIWTKELDEDFVKELPLTPFASEYYCLYNVTTKKYNKLSEEKGTYEYILVGYNYSKRAYMIIKDITITNN